MYASKSYADLLPVRRASPPQVPPTTCTVIILSPMDTFSTVFLVPCDLPRQRQPAIEGQVCDRGEENLLFGLVSEVELANNSAFVASVVNARNLA
jgi:hypothetical protein